MENDKCEDMTAKESGESEDMTAKESGESEDMTAKESVKIWLDDWRETPPGYVGVHSVFEAELMIINCENQGLPIVLVDVDYDLGMYETDGGNGLALLEWLNNRGTYYPVEIHSTHPIGVMRMENYVASFWP